LTSRILLVEDEASIRENLREMLEAEGFQVREASDGLQGAIAIQEDLPDLVVCDVMMPGLDGFQLLEKIRSDESTHHVPFLFLTARADRSSLRKGMEMGAEDYLTKPFSRAELLGAVRTRLARSENLAATYRRQLGSLRDTLSRGLPHELLTPLNGILGLSGILMEEFETVQREEMLDIARGISDSGEILHRLVRRFLGYAELEMALLDGKLRRRLSGTRCEDPDKICSRVVPTPPRSRPVEPAIVPDHLELLLGELCDRFGPFSHARQAVSRGRWELHLEPLQDPPPAHRRASERSDMSRASIAAACKVYGARFDSLPTGSLVVSIPLWSEIPIQA
jgi:DNA-binding response OmpR family regulator